MTRFQGREHEQHLFVWEFCVTSKQIYKAQVTMTITIDLANILTCSLVLSIGSVLVALLALRVCILKMQIDLNV